MAIKTPLTGCGRKAFISSATVSAFTLLAAALAPTAFADTLTIEFQKLRNSQGVVTYNLCQADEFDRAVNEQTGCRISNKVSVPSNASAVMHSVDVPSGEYSVMFLHDENNDGVAQFKGLFPAEGVGFSNDPALIFGMPKFSTTQFTVDGDTSVSMTTKYF